MGCVQSYDAPGNVRYNYAQLEGLWTQAGGPPQVANVAAAVAMAESGGNSTATCVDSNGSVDRGLWQINSVHGAQSTYDIMGNARAAVNISSQGRNWGPWTTFGSGAYRQFLQGNVPPDLTAPINGTNAAANQPGGTQLLSAQTQDAFNIFGLSPTAEPIVKAIMGGILNPIIQIFGGVLGIGAGGMLMILGFWLTIRQTSPYQQTAQATGGAVRTGARVASLFAGPQAGAVTTYVSQDPRTGEPRRTHVQRTTVRRPGRGPQVYTTTTREQLRGEAFVYGPEGNVGFRPTGWQPTGAGTTRHGPRR